jgi:hypothetical protein
MRRELSLLVNQQDSMLTLHGGAPPVTVRAGPASEFWLAFIDPKGDQFRESPAAFGVEFKHLQP